jgi:hypothetical protein
MTTPRDPSSPPDPPRKPIEPEPDYPPLHPERLTWAVLLSRWVELAKSALALGDDPASSALKKLVPDIIMLQALWHALEDMGDLPLSEQKLGCFRAQWLIDKHQQQIHHTWPADLPLHPALGELITDATDALTRAQNRIAHLSDPQSTDSQQSG